MNAKSPFIKIDLEAVSHEIKFRLLTSSDRALVMGWISSPHLQEWWGDPHEEWSLYQADIDSASVTAFIFTLNDDPTGLIQYWPYGPNRDYGRETGCLYMNDFPDDCFGVDISIGESDQLSKGIGSNVLKSFCAKLFGAGVKTITIDPDIKNTRAIRAYQKAGFEIYKDYGDTRLMVKISTSPTEPIARSATKPFTGPKENS